MTATDALPPRVQAALRSVDYAASRKFVPLNLAQLLAQDAKIIADELRRLVNHAGEPHIMDGA